MNRIRLALLAVVCLLSPVAYGQITGVQTIPGSFATLEAAVTALNASGVGAGGATINIAAGYAETPTTALVLTMVTNTPSAANPLVIQKSGSGSNPLITAFTPGVSTTVDGIFILNGVDYVTINGIDLQENAANVSATTQMEWGYALVKTSAANGAANNTIKNCTVTLNKTNTVSVGIYMGNHTSLVTTSLTVSGFGGTSSFNKFYNNTVTNCYTGYSINGFASAAPYDFYDQGNQIGVDGVSARRSMVTNYGGSTITANGIFAINQNGLKIFNTYINNTGGAPQTGTLNGIFTSTGLNSSVDIYNDTLVLSSASTTGSTLFGINNAMGGTGAGNTINIYNNVVDGCTYTTNTSGEFRGISTTATASYSTINNNKVTNNSIPGTGTFSGIYYSGSSATLVLNVNLNDNVVSNNTKTGTAGTFNMIFASASAFAINCYNNQLFNNAASASSGAMYGYYNFAFGYNEAVYNNQMYSNTGGSGEVVMVYVRSGSGPTNKEVYGNTIYNITANSAGFNVGGILVGYGTVTNIYRNNVYNISNTTATGLQPAVYGIHVDGNVNTQTTVSNNYVSDLKTPLASNTAAAIGLWLLGSANSVTNVYYNTVFMNGTSTGANYGTAAISCGFPTSGLTYDLRNNIFVNTSVAAGTGTTKALLRGVAALTSYSLTSGYNCYFAGTPSATNLIYSDGTNNDQTLQAFKDRVGPREQASFSVLPPFVNAATAPFDLHLQAAVATPCNNGGKTIPGLTIDFDNNTRGVLPDVGADEYSGTTLDLASPDIQYTLLGNSAVAATRVLNTFATITDPSAINTTVGTRPRIYYKRSTNANTYNTNTNATDGWKFVEASNTTSPFSFTIDYSLLFGGGVVAGDVIQYFVVAQDLNSTPRIGINSGGFTTQPANVNLAAANFPLNNTINQYTILAASFAGVVNVGPAELITSLTNAGGAFQAINAGALSGNLTLNITGDLTAETGTFALNQWAEEGAGNYTLTITSSAAVVRNIFGSSAAAALIRFDGADRVNIDGRFASAGTFLMFRNTSNAAPTIGFLNDAQNNTVQYTIIESGNTAISTTLGGAVWIGGTTGLNGNDNITISNCDIRDRSDVAGTSAIGINCVGTNGALSQYNNNCVFSNNTIHDWFLVNSGSQFAINIGVGNSGHTISGNSFYQTATRTHLVSGAITRAINISFSSTVTNNGGFIITNNFIGGTAASAGGGDMTLTVSGVGVSQAFGAISVISGTIPNQFQGNIIRKIDFTTNVAAAATTAWFGFNLGQGIHNVGNTTGNVIGDAAINNSIKITLNSGGAVSAFLAGVLAATTNGSYNIQNNTIAGITIAGTTASAIVPQWIQLQGTPSQASTVSNNIIGGPLANSIQNNSTTAPIISFAIRHLISTGATVVMNNNTIQNITDNGALATSSNYGILMISTVGGQGTMTITNNTIKDLSINAAPATPAFANLGLAIQGFGGTTHTVSGNLISGLVCANTGLFSGYAVGIQLQGNSLGGQLRQNRIWDIRNANTGSPGVAGIYLSAGLNWTISNNMISLSNTGNSNNVDLTGISDFMGQNATLNLYYNTIFIGGSPSSGVTNTAAYVRGGSANVTLRNNLFYNRRTGGAGNHMAIINGSVAPAAGWSSNYNALLTADTTKLNIWGVAVNNMSAWRTNSGGDANSIWQTTAAITTASLFVNIATGDLHINTSRYPEALGTPLVGITVDYDNNPRSATFPTIGADELACSAIAFTATAQTNVLCNGGSTGSATVGGLGGNGITYSWAPSGGTAATATGLAAGTYTCTITNICGNTGSVVVTITQPAVLAAAPSQTNVTCNAANNGSATVTASGGVGPYAYAWLPSGGSAATASGLAPGTYTCTITDANSCSTTQSFTITQPTVLVASAALQTNVSCNGGNNGSATVSVSGGTATYSYAWLPSGGSAATASGLTAGTYTCTVTDANSCTTTQTFSITQPPVLAATTMQTNVSCNAGNNGSAMVMVTGGTPSYSYSWASSGGNAATASGLTAGTYTCTITDGNSCVLTQTFNITQPAALVATPASQVNITCNGAGNGSATVSVVGGTPSYSYAWLPSGGSAATATGLTPGTYTCTITDANSCSTTQTFNITEPAVLAAAVATTVNPTTCGGSTGSIDLNTVGGTGPYTYLWNTTATTEDISGLTAGSYSVTVTDVNGCATTASATLTDPVGPVVTLSLAVDTVCQSTFGVFTLSGESPAGGTFSGTAVSGNTFDPLLATIGFNIVTYTFTDVNGCTGSTTDSVYVDICTGVTPVYGSLAVDIYPNPNNGLFTLQHGAAGVATVVVYDALGQLVSTQQVQPHVQQQLTLVNSGAYLITVITADGERTTKRVIVTH